MIGIGRDGMVGFEVENSKGFTRWESDLVAGSAAEESAEQVLNCVHPTLDSEEKRGDVIDYIQQLVKNRLLCEVVSYGSVPLKTYLPEGDIDLTVLKGPNAEETLIHDILAVIQEEERNENAEYEVRETQFIDAEVKLVKCLVRNIVIDISCNQLGGLSTLCFLEQVDRFIGRNHLFKRSIILIKTWCYYESRILGAHHGLISTYALETLVLYIFHFFHSSLNGPLSVLHRFLDYYSQFDWDSYCISLKGLVRKSSLHDITVDIPNVKASNGPLLSEEFLKRCTDMFSTSCKELEGNSKPFQIKHLNIVDPLKENNNLGRSVNRGNFYRIRSALKYGSYKLGLILTQSREDLIADEIKGFFANTCERHGNQNTGIMRNLQLDISDEESLTALISSPAVLSSDDDDSVCWDPEPVSGFPDELDGAAAEIASESCFEASNSSSWGGATDDLSSGNHSLCPSENRFSMEESNHVDSAYASWLSYGFRDEHSEATYTTSSGSVAKLDCREVDSVSLDGESEVLDAPADLTGDYDNHIRSLLRAQLCHASSMPVSPSSPFRSQLTKTWNAVHRRSMPLERTNSRGRSSESNFSSNEWHKKAQGIGTYFPKLNNRRLERPAMQGRYRSKTMDNRNPRFRSIIHHASPELHPAESRPRKPSTNRSESLQAVSETKDCLSGSFRIEFGSLGNLGEEMIARSRNPDGGSKAISAKESLERESIRLDDKEFPPLTVSSKPCLPCIR